MARTGRAATGVLVELLQLRHSFGGMKATMTTGNDFRETQVERLRAAVAKGAIQAECGEFADYELEKLLNELDREDALPPQSSSITTGQ
jgi:hypothetical protein